MISLLSKVFIKSVSINTPHVRQKYAVLCSIVSILLNVLLFAGKLIAGTISGSVALIADALNNLADAGTCIVELFGFYVAGIGAGKKHPFGHGRIEWLMGLFAAVAVIFMGFETLKSSIGAITTPQPVECSLPVFMVLIISIATKAFMFFYNRKIGTKIDSITLKSKAFDCIGDIAATTSVLVSMAIIALTGFQVDGWCGIIVSIFIIYAGINALNESINPLIGNLPDQELTKRIKQIAEEYPEVIEAYDITVHDYGFHRLFVSCHIGGSTDNDIKHLVQIADAISLRLSNELACEATVQVNLISTNKALHDEVLSCMSKAVMEVDSSIKINYIRIITNSPSPSIRTELLMPVKVAKRESEIKLLLENRVKQIDERFLIFLKVKVFTIQNKHKKFPE